MCANNMIAKHKNLTVEHMNFWRTKVLEKVDNKIAHLKRKIKPHKTNPVLKQPEIIQCLEELHKKFVLVPIDKAANNVAIICKKHYVDVILKEIGVSGNPTDTYKESPKNKDEIIFENLQYLEKLKLKSEEKDKELPIMYWTPKMHKNPTGSRFIIASKNCSTKPLSKTISSAFKLIYRQVEAFHTNSKYFSNYNKFWVLQNSDPVLSIVNHINSKKRAKSIS